MSDVVFYLQEAPDGAVLIAHCTEVRLRMRIGQLQAGNPDALLLRALYEGDRHALTGLLHRHAEHLIYDGWHTAEVLEDLPAELTDIPFDRAAEERLVALRDMRRLARAGGRP